MGETMRLAWSIAKSGWRATYNRTFRFSKVKAAVIFFVLQALFVLFVARRAGRFTAGTGQDELSGLMTLMAMHMSWFGLMYGFSRGQSQLYQGILVPLFQITPARPLGFLIGRVIESVPGRVWSNLLWAWAYSAILAGAGRWAIVLLLAGIGLLTGMLGHLSGLLLLTFWSRYSAKSMRNGLIFFGMGTLALATWIVIALAQGGTVADLASVMRSYRIAAMGWILLVGGLPGLLLMLALLLRPESVENLYRLGLYNVMELNEADLTRPARSIWLPIANPILRAVLSREWLELYRNRVTRIQFMIWVSGTVGVFFAGQAVAGQPYERVIQYVVSLSLLTWFTAYGHWVIRTFEKERRTVILYRLAAVSTRSLLLAKFISVLVPSALLVSISTLIGSLAAGLTGSDLVVVVAGSMGALAAGIVGGFGASAATAKEEPEDQDAEAAPQRSGASPQPVGNAWWSLLRTAALLITVALPIWTLAGQPGSPLKLSPMLLWSVSILLPISLLLIGATLMIRYWEADTV